MGPTMFREQLRTLFGLWLTRAEVAGLVSAFNLYRDGMVDAKEFSFRWARAVCSLQSISRHKDPIKANLSRCRMWQLRGELLLTTPYKDKRIFELTIR